MGNIILSRDCTYRESIAISTDSAIRKASIITAQGAHLIDIGAKSSTAKANRVSAKDQTNLLVPIIDNSLAWELRFQWKPMNLLL